MGIHLPGQGGFDEEEGEQGILSEINITPLTDVFLVLLIIFMVTSSVMTQMGVDVDLPESKGASSRSEPEGVILTLRSDGGLLLNTHLLKDVSPDSLRSAVQQALLSTKSKVVVLEGDRQVILGRAIEIMDLAREAGAQSFSIATQPSR